MRFQAYFVEIGTPKAKQIEVGEKDRHVYAWRALICLKGAFVSISGILTEAMPEMCLKRFRRPNKTNPVLISNSFAWMGK